MSDEFKVQWSVSLPPAAQYAKGDMLNIRGGSVEEVEGLFDAILAEEFIHKATEVATTLRVSAVVTDGLNDGAGYQTPDAPAPAPQPSAPPAASTARRCNHGVRTRREGNYKSGPKQGRPYVGFFCPLERGNPDQCKPEFEDR
jgi:hypothetical protein